MGALRQSVSFSKLDRKTNEYIWEKLDLPDTILNEIILNNSFGMDISGEWTQHGF
jgi:hypothetical protein